ncbi:MAG: hypothetical protein ACREQ5_10350 [Candidatus Dormibacteria bacterium]
MKVFPPDGKDFQERRPVFVDFRTANRLIRAGKVFVIRDRPIELRLKKEAAHILDFVTWSHVSAGYVMSGVLMDVAQIR